MEARTPDSPEQTGGPSLRFVWQIVTPSIAFVIAALYPIVPNDFWWHARTGAIIVAEHAIPTLDRFSFTRAGIPWTNFAWGSDVAIHALLTAGGPPLVVLIHALAIAAGVTILGTTMSRLHGARAAGLATFTGAMVGVFDWNIRPQVASLLFFPILVSLIERDRSGSRRALFWTIPLFALWSNLHGGFVFGASLLGLYALSRWIERTADRNRVTLVSVAAVAALGINPNGPGGVARYVAGFATSPLTLAHVTEFQPLVATTTDGMIFFGAVALLLVVLARTRTKLTTYETASLVVFALATLSAQRIAPWFGFVLIPPLARGLGAWFATVPESRGIPALNAIVIATLGIAVLVAMPGWRNAIPALEARCPLVSRSTPVDAVRSVCATLPAGARGFQDQVFASYLVAACPTLPVFTDTRIELYTPAIFDDYRALASGRWDWESVADRWAMTYLFVSTRRNPRLLDAVERSPRWRALYRDEIAVVFVRVS